MIKVKNIELTRVEGPIDECDETLVFETYIQANEQLRKWSITAPTTGGYDKCKFLVRFEDDDTYEGRYDLKGLGCEQDEGYGINLQKRINDHLRFIANKVRPAWMNDEQWEESKKFNESYVASAEAYLEKYEV